MNLLEPIIITNVIESGAGFAVRVNGGAAVYIPPQVGPLDQDDVGEEVQAVLVGNTRSDTPYKAQFLDWDNRIKTKPEDYEFKDRAQADNPPAPTPPVALVEEQRIVEAVPEDTILTMSMEQLRTRVSDVMLDANRPLTIRMVLDLVRGEDFVVDDRKELIRVKDALFTLWEHGNVSKASIYTKGTQIRSSWCYWALSPDVLTTALGGGSEEEQAV